MPGLIDGAISRARMVIGVLICALIAGAVAYIELPKEADPDVAIPFVGITLPLEGVSPEDAERLLIRPAEAELQDIEGLKQLDSFAAEGVGQLLLEFENSFDPEQALIDVRERMDRAQAEFPDDAEEPIVTELNASLFPILVVNLYGEATERGLNRIARDLQEELEQLPGVLEAPIQGQREEVLEIVLDPAKLETYNISYQEILDVVTANNRLVPAGQIDTGEGRFAVKVPGLIKSARDAYDLPIKQSGDAVVTLEDVASVRRTFKDRATYARFNREPALSVQIVKRPGENILDTVEEVRAVVERAEALWPETVRATLTSDLSVQVDSQLGGLRASITTAVVLVMIIVVAALGLRSGALVGISIPASFVLAFLLLAAYGLTINIMVMFGMVIAVGILVDGAIVVVEYADRKMAEGFHRREAYSLAAKRMFWPIVASTATTLAAFVPFLFWDSLIGDFMSYLPLTLIFVLCSSLVMALIFLPVLGSIFGGRAQQGGAEDLRALSGDEGDPAEASGWIGGYVRVVSELMRRPLLTTAGAFAAIAAIFAWFGSTSHKTELFLDLEPEQVFVFVRAQGSLSAEEQFEIVGRVEDALTTVDGIAAVSTQAGTGSGSVGFFDGASAPLDTVGRILLDLRSLEPGYDGRAIERDIRDRLAGLPGALTEVQAREQGPPVGKDVQVGVLSNNPAALEQVTSQIREKLESMNGLREIEDTRPLPGIEWRLAVDRAQAGKFGVDVTQIGAAVQLITNGILVGRFRPDDALDEVDIRVRLPEGERSVEAIDRLRISTPDGQVPLSLFVTREIAPRVDKIDRRDGKRYLSIRANTVRQGEGAAKVAEIKDWIETAGLDPRVDIVFEGADEDTEDALAFFEVATYAALFMMAVILLWEFNTFYHVGLTLFAVVLSTAGVLIGIQLVLPYISIMMIGVGVVALAGIVVNNNIVLIDTFKRLKEAGRTTEEAALATAAQRLRPILLTTLTTICGLVPIILQMNVDFVSGQIRFGDAASEWWVPLATAVVFGLGFSTIMTLLVTPVWLAAPAKIARLRDRLLASAGLKRAGADATPAE